MAPGGLNFTLELQYQRGPKISNHVMDSADSRKGDSSRLLLVEDELVVGMFMHELLETIGYRPTEPVGRLSDAMAMAARERFAGAVLDMNLNGEIVYPLAELLTEQSVPFVFVTGYAPHSVDPRFTAVPILQKPVLQEDLADILQNILDPRPHELANGCRQAPRPWARGQLGAFRQYSKSKPNLGFGQVFPA